MAKKADDKTIKKVLGRGMKEIIVREHLENDLLQGADLRIKLGADPTAPDLHLGHAVVLRKLREFQEFGHTVVFIIGDYTALIGDPSGKSKTRPPLAPEEIAKNAKTYFAQVGKILDLKKTEVHYNSEWFRKMSIADLIRLAAQFSTQRTLERDDFTNRLKEGTEIAQHELLYPLMQAYDSVVVKASVEIGGTDQKFNMLAGRELQKKMGMTPQDVVTCPLLVGLDGEKKMSKSLGNYIALKDTSADMFGKVMSIPDKLIVQYFELATDLAEGEIAIIKKELEGGGNPRDIKARLAREIVTLYHGAREGKMAEKSFVRVFSKKEMPADMPKTRISKSKINILELLVITKLVPSKSEARRVTREGGVRVDGNVIKDINADIEIGRDGVIIQKGKKTFLKIFQK